MIIDFHGHIGAWFNFPVARDAPDWLVSVNRRIGIGVVGVSHLDAISAQVTRGNDLALAARDRFPAELGVWLVGDPHHPGSVRYLAEHLDDPGVWGVKLHPDTHAVPLDDPRYDAILAVAAEHGAPVLSHTDWGSPPSTPDRAATVADRYPGLAIVAGHAGLDPAGFDRSSRLAAERTNLYLEICGSRMTARWIGRLVERAGAERVLFGTDANFLDPRPGLGRALAAPMSQSDRELVLAGNARRLLGARLVG